MAPSADATRSAPHTLRVPAPRCDPNRTMTDADLNCDPSLWIEAFGRRRSVGSSMNRSTCRSAAEAAGPCCPPRLCCASARPSPAAGAGGACLGHVEYKAGVSASFSAAYNSFLGEWTLEDPPAAEWAVAEKGGFYIGWCAPRAPALHPPSPASEAPLEDSTERDSAQNTLTRFTAPLPPRPRPPPSLQTTGSSRMASASGRPSPPPRSQHRQGTVVD